MPSRLRNWLIWAAFAVAIVVLARDFNANLFVGSGRLTVVTEGLPDDTVEFRWHGKIEPPMQSKLADAFREWGPRKRRIILALSSPGGSVSHGEQVVQLLRRIGQTHALETVVESGRSCASMCVPVYLQGQKRFAAPRARFMFHEVSLRDVVTDKRIRTTRQTTTASTDRLFERFFRPAGVPDAWISRVRRAMTSGDVWKTGRELIEEGANVVQQMI
jgi:ATP-dependent protease ClpP protease subunit